MPIAIIFVLSSTLAAQAQPAPFAGEIAAFKSQDSAHQPPSGAILFVGSSSFRIWSDVQDYFPGYTIINRGFGGSTFPDVTRYAGDIIFPYHPKQVVIYCGDNDLASSDTVTAQVVYQRFLTLYRAIRANLQQVDVLYVSIKPSPSRANLMPRMEAVNRLIGDFLHSQPHAAFADVYHPMLNPQGQPMAELFRGDQLHMNPKGYAIWKKILLPYLDK